VEGAEILDGRFKPAAPQPAESEVAP
jgi:hypothetical protein